MQKHEGSEKSAAGDLVMKMFAAFAQIKCNQLAEQTHAGLERAKTEGRVSGRLMSLVAPHGAQMKVMLAASATSPGLAKEYGVSRDSCQSGSTG